MLFLMGAIVGVFAAQDLLLFCAFFEAMLIPLYVLVGVWGGPGRMGATLKFVLYTMAGSLLMLASIVVYGLSEHTFDLVQIGQSSSQWIFLGFVAAFARGGGRSLGRRLQGGGLRLPAHRGDEVPRAGARLPRADPRARRDRPDL